MHDGTASGRPEETTAAHRDWPTRGWQLMLQWPWLTLLLAIAVLVAFGSGLGNVSKDPSVDAFVPGDHPAALARDQARELFGLEDPLVVGLAVQPGGTAFRPDVLTAVRTIGTALADLPNVDKNGIMSIATENAISGTDDALAVDPLLAGGPVTQATAALAAERLATMPMFDGLLASATGDLLTLIVPVEDPNAAEDTYLQIRELAERLAPPGVRVHVAGVAAMNGRLARMVNEDTRVFVPAAVVTALIILLFALRQPKALAGPFFVIVASCAVAVGCMGWLGARYYLITTALPVIVLAIAIADSLHISVAYLRETAAERAGDIRAGIVLALQRTFLPVTLTSVTTIAGFTGLAIGSPMRPISEFGIFAAVGVAAAWFFSVTALPAIMLLTKLEPGSHVRQGRPWMDRMFAATTRMAFERPVAAATGLAIALALFAVFAAAARFDYERKRYFIADDAVRIADEALNTSLSGTHFLDVVISADEPEGLMPPAVVASLRALQDDLTAQPLVQKAIALPDYISLMHAALTGAPAGELPTREHAPAQYFLLYEASGDPGDFDTVIDYGYQHTLLRTQLLTDRYSETAPVVAAFRERAAEFSATTGLTAKVSGRVAVNEGWMSLLAASHFKGLGLAALLVLVASIAAFRSVGAALLAFVPVASGVLLTYAAMGALAIDIAPATSMTAAIATGLGVDFGIHLISQFRRALADGLDPAAALGGHYVTVGRACCFSAIALAIALSVICLSSAPPLRWFGALVAAAVIGSLIGAVLILPTLFGLRARLSRTQPATATGEPA